MERAEPSPRITVARPFNFDDLRAVVGEELGAEGTGGVVGQIKDPGPGKGLWRRDGFGTFQHDSCVNIAGRMSLGNNSTTHLPPEITYGKA